MTRCRTPSKTMKMRPRRRATYSCERRRERRGKWAIECDVKGGSRLSRDVTGVIHPCVPVVVRSWRGVVLSMSVSLLHRSLLLILILPHQVRSCSEGPISHQHHFLRHFQL